MKVLYLTNYGGMYGANRSLNEMIIELRDRYGVSPLVLISGKYQNGFPLANVLNEHNIEHFSIPFRPIVIDKKTKCLGFRKITRRIFRYLDYRKVLKEIKENYQDIELIHTNTSIVELGFFLSKKLNVPHIWHIREYYEEHYNLVNVLSRRQIAKEYRGSTLISVSRALKNYIESRYIDICCNVVYNRVSTNAPYAKEYRVGGRTRFAVIGAINESKGQKTVVDAGKRLLDEKLCNFEIHFWGDADEIYLTSMKRELHENNQLAERVFFHGYSDNILNELRNMDVGIVPSRNEAFGRTTIEFWANYMLVIGCNSGGSIELIEDSNLLFEFGNDAQLAIIMKRIINDPELLYRDGEINREKAIGISSERNIEEIYHIYCQAEEKDNSICYH